MIETANVKYDALRFDEAKLSTKEKDPKSQTAEKVKSVQIKLGGTFNGEKTRIHAWAF